MGQNYPVNVLADTHGVRREIDQSDRVIYEGFALARHQLRDKTCWVIRKFTYTGANLNYDTQCWADGDSAVFNKTWSLRATYTYA